MLLNKRQKKILRIVRDWGGMKKETLSFLCGESGGFERDFIQLVRLGLIHETAGYYCDEGKRICERETETAFEVLMSAFSSPPDMLLAGEPPFSLSFFKERGEKLYRYDICVAERGREAYITAAAEAKNLKSRIVIFVIEDEKQIPLLKISGEYRFAVKRNGIYHFYGGN